jgi:uncharacterized protein YjbJ (UPF0337 family)
MKNLDGLVTNWNETKVKLQKEFAILTEKDVTLVEGKVDELLSRLEVKLGKTKTELHKFISEL